MSLWFTLCPWRRKLECEIEQRFRCGAWARWFIDRTDKKKGACFREWLVKRLYKYLAWQFRYQEIYLHFSYLILIATPWGRCYSYPHTGIPCSNEFHFIVLHIYCIFYKLKVCGNPISSTYWHDFSNSICSLYIFVLCFCNSCNIFNFFIIMSVMVFWDQWYLILLL